MIDPKSDQLLSYDSLKNFFKNERISYSKLADLKELFTTHIDSVRRLEAIRTLGDLTDCLERLDVFSEYNINALRQIADNLDNTRLHAVVAAYIAPSIPSVGEFINYYRLERLTEGVRHALSFANPRPAQQHVTSSSFPSNGQRIQDYTEAQRVAVYKLISREIGLQWRFLGRELEVSEGEMDAVELQHPSDLPSRIFKILKLFEEAKSDRRTEHINIIRIALDACGRKDLRRKVNQLIDDIS